jgi:hypothetical protein
MGLLRKGDHNPSNLKCDLPPAIDISGVLWLLLANIHFFFMEDKLRIERQDGSIIPLLSPA